MWVEKLPSGHYRYCERFVDPVTGETKRVSITLDKHTKQTEKMAYELLRQKMYESNPSKVTFRELCEMYLNDQKPYLKASTWERNRICLGTLQSILGANTRVEKMTAGWIRQKLQLSGRAPGTGFNFRCDMVQSQVKSIGWRGLVVQLSAIKSTFLPHICPTSTTSEPRRYGVEA